MELTKRPEYPWIIVITYSLLGVCMPAAVTQFTMLVETMAKEMMVDEQTILLADSLRAVCLVTAMFLSGVIHKKFGMRKTMMLGLFFQIAPQFLIPLAVHNRNLVFFYLAKGMQGLNAVAFPLYLANISAWSSSRQRGLATAVFNGSFTAGAGVGAWVSSMIIPRLGWQMSFYFVGFCCLFFAVPVILITREKETADVYEGRPAQKKKDSGQYFRILKSRTTWLLILALLANTWIAQAVTVDMSVYSSYLSFSYAQTGNLMLLISIVTVIASVLAGGISDYFASKAKDILKSRVDFVAAGYVVAAIAAAVLPAVAGAGFFFTAAAASLMMVGISWAQGVYWAIPGELYEAGDNVVVTAICSGAANIVNPVAPMVVGVILGTRGFWHIGWLTCSAMALLSLAAVLLIPKGKKQNTNDRRKKRYV